MRYTQYTANNRPPQLKIRPATVFENFAFSCRCLRVARLRDISYSRACKPDISCSSDEDSVKGVTDVDYTTALSGLCSPLLPEKLGSARESQCDDWPSEDFPAGEPSLTRTAQWTTYFRRFQHPQLLLPSRKVFPHPLQSVFRAAHLFLCWIRSAGRRSDCKRR